MKNPYQLIIADDNKFFGDALKSYLDNHPNFNVIRTCNTLKETIATTPSATFDLLILDLSFNGTKSIDHIQAIRPDKNSFKIVCLTSFNNSIIKEEILNSGVDFFMGKDESIEEFPSILTNLLQEKPNQKEPKTHVSKYDLTLRQIDIIQTCFEFSTEKEIAGHLHISINTLKTHKQHLFAKTNTKNNLELIKYGIKEGIIVI